MTLSAALFLALSLIQNPQPQSDMALTLACGEEPTELVLTIRNSGPSDTALRLGLAFESGRWYEPRELIVELTRSGNAQPEDLVYSGTRGVAGRIDHWIVPLPTRAAFSLTLRSSDFVSTTQPTSAARPEALAVRLTGRALTSELTVDMGGMKGWRVWTGSARSNSLQLSECSQLAAA